ncbi:MAG: 4-alpha-glucanotransferase [Thermoanaerobaculales bacterium]|jgi:4-alpha-glucanotransferase|nr:4-alpha-glucanotransferase [Thermoanaerobaculales bacterium]
MQRSAGILLHPTSLPSAHGIGDLGPSAHAYVDWLAAAGVGWWQILPLNPPGPGNSPYSATSTFAGNPMLISPELLVEDGLLDEDVLIGGPALPHEFVDYRTVIPRKRELLDRAFEQHRDNPGRLGPAVDAFRADHSGWIEDFALFSALKHAHGGAPWYDWPEPLARRDPAALSSWVAGHRDAVDREIFAQLLFHRQWSALREHAADVRLGIFGDVPIFVALDSAEVWARPELFLMGDDGRPTVVAGVPPDYFSRTGQLWGNPLYDWVRMAADGYRWWLDRLAHTMEQVDLVRLDHFRGFAAYWEVPADAETAVGGRWVDGPGRPFFEAVSQQFSGLPFIAEDLGEITPDVMQLRDDLGLPGMVILHFGFSPEPRSIYIPYAHRKNQVVYTGTHDNNTTVGWFLEDASDDERALVTAYAGSDGSDIHWDLIRMAMASPADLAVVPHQDLAGLGADCRMNTPSVGEGNWRFRITPWMLGHEIHDRLAGLVETYGRATIEASQPARR